MKCENLALMSTDMIQYPKMIPHVVKNKEMNMGTQRTIKDKQDEICISAFNALSMIRRFIDMNPNEIIKGTIGGHK